MCFCRRRFIDTFEISRTVRHARRVHALRIFFYHAALNTTALLVESSPIPTTTRTKKQRSPWTPKIYQHHTQQKFIRQRPNSVKSCGVQTTKLVSSSSSSPQTNPEAEALKPQGDRNTFPQGKKRPTHHPHIKQTAAQAHTHAVVPLSPARPFTSKELTFGRYWSKS